MTKSVLLFILFTLILGPLSARAQEVLEFAEDVDYSCLNLLHNLTSDDVYHVETENGDFFAQARIDYGGLTFDFQLKGKHGQRHPDLWGKEQFDRIVNHFRGQFTHIIGHWTVKKGADSDNLAAFRKAYSDGKSPEDAALSTWTGQRADELGYRKVKVRYVILEGSDPRVEVEFWPGN